MITSAEFRKAMSRFASGVTVVTVKVGDMTHGMTVSAFFSLSLDPPLVGVAIRNRSKLHALLAQAESFGVSILSAEQSELSDHFAGRRREGIRIQFVEADGVPLIPEALTHICCSVAERYDGGDHTIYTGLVHKLEHREGEPLIHYSGNYRSLMAMVEYAVR